MLTIFNRCELTVTFSLKRQAEIREALAAAGKSPCKANAAVARELACWVWEIGRRAEGTLG